MSSDTSTLGPAVAGTWYPADSTALEKQIDGFLDAAPAPESAGAPLALVEPHAGYVYSGQVAAHGFRHVRNFDVERVLLLGPSHYASFGGAAIPDATRYRTPLGDVPLDREALTALAGEPDFEVLTRAFAPEHSLESEIPFLQRALRPGFRLVPVLLGFGARGERAQRIADRLRGLLGPRTLTVVSSDFTHYGAHFDYVPFTDDVPRRIRELDMGAVETIRAGDADAFESYVSETGATICGRSAIDVLLRLLPLETDATLVAYDSSGNMTGDWHHSVSYASLVFTAPAAAGP